MLLIILIIIVALVVCAITIDELFFARRRCPHTGRECYGRDCPHHEECEPDSYSRSAPY